MQKFSYLEIPIETGLTILIPSVSSSISMLMIIDTHVFTHLLVHIGPTNTELIFLTYVK